MVMLDSRCRVDRRKALAMAHSYILWVIVAGFMRQHGSGRFLNSTAS